MNIAEFTCGAREFLAGFSLVNQPGLRRYVLLPFFLNIVIFSLAIWVAAEEMAALIGSLTAQLPEWLDWLAVVLWILFAAASLLLVFFAFTLVANLVGAPFNSVLAEKVEARLTGEKSTNFDAAGLLAAAWRDLRSEFTKLRYFLGLVLLGAVLSLALLPLGFTTAFIPFLWFAISAWSLGLEYCDYPLANHGIGFAKQRALARQRRALVLGFGSAATLASMIPIVNFVVMPVAVAGATRLWVKHGPLPPGDTQKP